MQVTQDTDGAICWGGVRRIWQTEGQDGISRAELDEIATAVNQHDALVAVAEAARELMFLFVESDIPEHNRHKVHALRNALEVKP